MESNSKRLFIKLSGAAFITTSLPVCVFSIFIHNEKFINFIDFYYWWKLNSKESIELREQLLKAEVKNQTDYEMLIKRDFQEARTVNYKGLILSKTEATVMAMLGYKLSNKNI